VATEDAAGLPSARPRRGRTPTRSRREIADAAIAVADREGLVAVTMRSVAQSLDTGAASLYRYISTRDELLSLMVDEANGEFDLRGPDRRSWEDQMLDLAHQARAIYRRHPWLIEALSTTPALGPNGYAYLDHAIAILASTGADGGTMLEAVGVFNGLVRLLCKQERDQRLAAETRSDAALADRLSAQASPAGPYPHLAAALADTGPPDDQFDRVLRRVLSGLLP
jgi:AcrR family transcriptional regulator